jgi:uncharacterized tellurite resistance protein B-like protein
MWLLDRVRAHLEGAAPLATDGRGEPVDLEVKAAAAVLLLEAAHGDETYAWKEERALLQGLESAFGIGRKETRLLLQRAEEIRPPVLRLDDVTEVLATRLGEAQRESVLALLWQVIDADAVLEPWEAAFAAHATKALGLSPEQSARARTRARRGHG